MFSMRCNIFSCSFFILFFSSTFLGADASLVDVSRNLDSPVHNIIYALLLMALLIGFGFLVGSLFLWRRHRENPAHVPLSQVIFAVVIGLISIVVPLIASKVNGYDFFNTNDSQEIYVESQLSNTYTPPSRKSPQLSPSEDLEPTKPKPKRKAPLWEES